MAVEAWQPTIAIGADGSASHTAPPKLPRGQLPAEIEKMLGQIKSGSSGNATAMTATTPDPPLRSESAVAAEAPTPQAIIHRPGLTGAGKVPTATADAIPISTPISIPSHQGIPVSRSNPGMQSRSSPAVSGTSWGAQTPGATLSMPMMTPQSSSSMSSMSVQLTPSAVTHAGVERKRLILGSILGVVVIAAVVVVGSLLVARGNRPLNAEAKPSAHAPAASVKPPSPVPEIKEPPPVTAPAASENPAAPASPTAAESPKPPPRRDLNKIGKSAPRSLPSPAAAVAAAEAPRPAPAPGLLSKDEVIQKALNLKGRAGSHPDLEKKLGEMVNTLMAGREVSPQDVALLRSAEKQLE
jgi:hypothetical protein